jgi:CheY-like chemotaxis protein
MNFIWIDDDPGRKRFVDSIKNHVAKKLPKANVEFVCLFNREPVGILNTLLHKARPDIIIIDHVLNRTKARVITDGATVAEIFRHKWPACPIVGITGAEKKKDINFHKASIYEDLFTIDRFPDRYDSLFILAFYLKYMRRKKIQDMDQLFKLLNPPDSDIERLNLVIPEDIKGRFGDKSLVIGVFWWLRDVLFAKPGFLYDPLWTATFLGIKEESMHKVERFLKPASYNAVFENYSGPRWWVSVIRELLYKKLASIESDLPWRMGHRLPGIKAEDHVECYVCGEEYPETVAFIDESSNKRVPMHLKCTVVHPRFKKSIFFEEIRMMKDD